MSPAAKKNSFMKQAAILAAASLFVRFVGFLYNLPFNAFVGDVGTGYYQVAYQIYVFALVVSSMGLPAAVSKMVSERLALKQYRNAHEVFKQSMIFAVAVGTVCAVALAFGAGWIADMTGKPQAVYAIRTLSPTVLIVAVMAVFRGYFQGMRSTVPTAVSQCVEQVFNALFSLLLAYIMIGGKEGIEASANGLLDPKRIEYAAAGGAAGTGFGAVAGLAVVAVLYAVVAFPIKQRAARDRRYSNRERRGELLLSVIKTALPIIIGTAVYSISNIVDSVMIHNRMEASGAFTAGQIDALFGQYSGKYLQLTNLPVSLSMALAVAVIPSIAGSKATLDHSAVENKINMALRVSMLISIPAAVGLSVLGDPIVSMLFPKYPEGGFLLKYGAFAIVFLAVTQISTGILQGIGRINIPVIGAVAGVSVKVLLNYFLIADPDIGIMGAVISTCACAVVAAAVGLIFLWKYTGVTPDWAGAFVKPALSAAAMGLSCFASYHAFMALSSHNAVSALTSVLVSVAVYFVCMVLIKGFRREDLEMLPVSRKLVRLLMV
jgi:stage V sporulation protein B